MNLCSSRNSHNVEGRRFSCGDLCFSIVVGDHRRRQIVFGNALQEDNLSPSIGERPDRLTVY